MRLLRVSRRYLDKARGGTFADGASNVSPCDNLKSYVLV